MTRATSLVLRFWQDQSGFVLTAELVLISTLLVLGLIVGLTSVQSAVVGELNDVGAAIGSLNQSYQFQGMLSRKGFWGGPGFDCGIKAYTAGSVYVDLRDECDAETTAAMSCALSGLSTAPAAECDVRTEKLEKAEPKPDRKEKDKKDKDKN